jgi:phosphoribosylanthranilate isomerase
VTAIKVCGLSTPEAVDAALAAGAAHLGFVHFPASPRHVAPERVAALADRAPAHVGKVAVLVDPDDALIDRMLAAGCDTIQLHGREPTERLAAIRMRTGAKVWRAAGVASAAEIRAAATAAGPADLLLLDAKAPSNASLPGGNGLRIDWRIMTGLTMTRPWGLAGGLDAANVGEAVAVLRPMLVDVSSGVEDAPGVKSPTKIAAFAAAVRSAR